jgi:hypothetical protein
VKRLLASFKILNNLFLQFNFLKLRHLKKKIILNIIPEIAKECLFRLFFPMIGYFLQCTCQSRLSEQFRESQAAFGTTFRITGNYPKSQNKPPEEGYWKDFQN